ncbi:hypothetical protein FSOLCH5_000516 [Fusarium solani]
MANPPPHAMAMDPPHITEFASERYFEKLNQLNAQQQHQHHHHVPPTHDSLDASTSAAQPSRFILPLRDSRAAEVEAIQPNQRRDNKSRFHKLRHKVSILHSKSTHAGSYASPFAPRSSVEPQKR